MENSILSWTSLLASIITAIATGVLAWVTIILANETKRMAAASQQPHVVAILEPNKWSILHADIKIINSGNATAYDIIVDFDPPLTKSDIKLDQPIPFKRISVLNPGDNISSYLDRAEFYLGKSYNITISWKRNPNTSLRESHTYNFDMRDYDGLHKLGGGDPLVQIANHIKEIRQDWKNIASGFNHLKIDTYNSSDREAEEVEILNSVRKQRSKTSDLDNST